MNYQALAYAAVAAEWKKSGEHGTPYSHEHVMEALEDHWRCLDNLWTERTNYQRLEALTWEAERSFGLIV